MNAHQTPLALLGRQPTPPALQGTPWRRIEAHDLQDRSTLQGFQEFLGDAHDSWRAGPLERRGVESDPHEQRRVASTPEPWKHDAACHAQHVEGSR